ncbi:DMT family transporter [Novosphingobium sp. 9U]|uniref:DMT family transporter n=1 Tax=Novosphingobium sp. 9U TaxID=2653158 RepID=UPI0012EF461C|nr:DMT family transporter [Novosphingobium sp. 9U]VWX48412.1 Threonine/homoserine efflux transporter RhtA [Novosphingobium sp. 9U]
MANYRSPALSAYAALALTMLFWAGNSIVGRAVRGDIPPFTLAFGRWTLALLVLTPFAMRSVAADWPLVRRGWRPILFLGLVGVAAFNGFLYSGLRYTSASNGLLLQALIPGMVLLIGVSVFRDKARPGQVLGVLLSTFGVTVIVFRGDIGTVLRLGLGPGDGLVLCGCVAWAIYTACLRLRPDIRPVTFLFATFCVGAAAMAPFSVRELATVRIVWTPKVVAAFGYVAIFPSLCAYLLYNGAVARLGSGPAGQMISLMPLFGSLLAAQLLEEQLHPYHALGMAMILGGIVLSWVSGIRSSRDRDIDGEQPERSGSGR